jgi:hypothetical protein
MLLLVENHHNKGNIMRVTTCLTAILMLTAIAHAADDGSKPADMSKPVKVFIMMGQSNMLQYGKLGSPDGSQAKTVYSGIKAGKYTYLVDADKKFKQRKDARYIWTMQFSGVRAEEWLGAKKKVGVELGTGWRLADYYTAPLMMLKAAIGNRGLGWDLLPPSVGRYTVNGKEFPGYREYTDDAGKIQKYVKGVSKVTSKKGRSRGKQVDPWYAGKNYDDDTGNAKKVLADLAKHYPGATKFEVAGFFWWQGAKDQNANWAARYEVHLVELIKSLRKDFNAPNAPFVVATLGVPDGKLSDSPTHKIVAAQLAVDGRSAKPKYKEFKDNVATVDTRKFYGGSSANGHYGGNGEFIMQVGDEMGKAMVELLKKQKGEKEEKKEKK